MTDLSPSQQLTNRAALVAALRSGAYAQTHRNLASGPTEAPSCFCVMGLACHLSGLGQWEPFQGGELYFRSGPRAHLIFAAPAVLDYYGFSNKEENDLIYANDHNASFEDLADLIEALPPPSDDE